MTLYMLDARAATPHFPGIGRYVRNLATALIARLDAHESLALIWDPSAPGAWDPTSLATDGVTVHPAGVSPFGLSQQWQLPRLLRTLSPSPVSHPQSPIYHSPYYLMPYRTGLPTVLTFYDLIPLRYPEYVSPRARLLFRLATQLALRVADKVVAISQAARRDLLDHFRVPPADVAVTPLAADPRFQPQTQMEIQRIRSRHALPATFLLYLGINKPHKNLPALVRAYATLASPHCPLVIAGAWDDRYPESQIQAQRLHLGETVRFLGPVDDRDLPGLYAAATLFVFPSRYEGFGLPVLEAMACGTPVLCSNRSSLPEIVGEAALTVDPDDEAAMGAGLARAMQDPTLRETLSERGLDRARRFSWATTAARTLEVYRSL